jgi:hypothetical protein
MHFYMHSYLHKKFHSCKKWVLQRASATVFMDPDLYSMVKSKPNSLPTQWCCGDCGKELVEQLLKVVVVRLDDEAPPPQV